MSESNPALETAPKQTTFGISHLLGVTAIIAIALASAFPGNTWPGQVNPQPLFWKLVFGFTEMFIGVFTLSGAAWCLLQWWREKKLPSDPGCNLFLFCGAGFLMANFVQAVFSAMMSWTEGTINEATRPTFFAGFTYVRLLPSFFLLFVSVAVAGKTRGRWKIAWLMLALSQFAAVGPIIASHFLAQTPNPVTASAFQKVHMASMAFFGAGFLAVVVCCLIDVLVRVKRRRAHWLGVVCFLLWSLLPSIVLLIATRFVSIQQLYNIKINP